MRRNVMEGILFLPAMALMALGVFAVFAAIIAAGWYAFLGWMWLWTLIIPLPRPVGGALSVLCTALTIYGTLHLVGRPRR